jgi:hypothetical protein
MKSTVDLQGLVKKFVRQLEVFTHHTSAAIVGET